MELLISKVLLAAAKMTERIVDVVHEKVVEKEVPVLKEEPEQAVVLQKELQLPKKPEEPLLLSKYPVIMELAAELKRRNEEIFAVEQERGNLLIDIQNSIKAQESRGYEQWAKIHNLKQAAKTLNFLTEHKIEQYAELTAKIAEITAASSQALPFCRGNMKSSKPKRKTFMQTMGS